MYRLDGGNRPPGKDWNCSLTCRTTVLAARIAKAWMAKGVAVPQRVSTGSGGDVVAEMKKACLSERGLSGMSAPKQAYRDDSGTDGEGVLVEKVSSTPHHHTHNRFCLPVFVPQHTDACMVWIVPCESLCQGDGAGRVESTSDQEDRKPARAYAGKRKRATDVDSAAPPTASPDKLVCARVHVCPQPHRHWRGLSHILCMQVKSDVTPSCSSMPSVVTWRSV